MCRKPIRIKNNGKYITENTGYQYYIWVNCGHCEECIKAKQMEWNLRTYYQCKECLNEKGNTYLYFDTLTYNNENLPRITNYIKTNKNFSCFNYRDIRQFYEKLRQDLKLKKDDKIKYFITSEYGDIRHRPHYHILLFVYDENIDGLRLSKAVANAWNKGRTDGIPYKSKQYVLTHNIIKEMNLDCIRYVAKYVNKSQIFMDIINKRWKKLEKYYEKTKFDKLEIKRIRKQYYRLTTPFHRQSRNFGIEALRERNINDIIRNPILWYNDDTISITKKVHLPMYYYRKIFAKQIKYNGKRIWINTEDGIRYKQEQEEKLIERTTDKILDQATNNNTQLTNEQAIDLAIYILFKRGRLAGKQDYKAHHTEATIYNYNTNKDLKYIGKKTLSTRYAGNDKIGYCTTDIEPTTIENLIYIEPQKEAIIEALQKERDTTQLVKLKEHMNEIKKIFFQ